MITVSRTNSQSNYSPDLPAVLEISSGDRVQFVIIETKNGKHKQFEKS